MKVAGIVAEYNPFHNGHEYHIFETRNAGYTHIVAVMSGNFTQRGEPAVMLKSARCEAALNGGVDLVIELPLPWAMSSAESFSYGAVSILNALGCVDTISFGSEGGDTEKIKKYAEKVIGINNHPELKAQLKKGYSFPTAREIAITNIYGEDEKSPLKAPNDLLGIEYIKALKKLDSKITPLAVTRKHAAHDSENTQETYASASYIRSLILSGDFTDAMKFIPEYAAGIYSTEFAAGRAPIKKERLEPLVLAELRRLNKDEIINLPDVSEGLENRIYDSIRQTASLDGLFDAIKSKRYTMSRIRRIIISAFLGLNKEYSKMALPYIRVLGFNARGLEILKEAKLKATLPIIDRYSGMSPLDEAAKKIYELECLASDLYSLCTPTPMICGNEQRYKTVRLV